MMYDRRKVIYYMREKYDLNDGMNVADQIHVVNNMQ